MALANENWKDKRVIVTGGAGFIGSVLVWELNRRGCSQVVIADFRRTAKKAPISPVCATRNISSPRNCSRGFRPGRWGQLDCIFHLGACSSTTETNEKYLRENNYEYSRRLAEWALGAGVRFVYASSAATYGDGSAGMDDSDPRQLERLRPLNLYGQSKQWMDLHAWRAGMARPHRGAEIFQRLRPQRKSQRRHAQRGLQELRRGARNRRDSSLQELSPANTGTASSGAIFFTSRTPWP